MLQEMEEMGGGGGDLSGNNEDDNDSYYSDDGIDYGDYEDESDMIYKPEVSQLSGTSTAVQAAMMKVLCASPIKPPLEKLNMYSKPIVIQGGQELKTKKRICRVYNPHK